MHGAACGAAAAATQAVAACEAARAALWEIGVQEGSRAEDGARDLESRFSVVEFQEWRRAMHETRVEMRHNSKEKIRRMSEGNQRIRRR